MNLNTPDKPWWTSATVLSLLAFVALLAYHVIAKFLALPQLDPLLLGFPGALAAIGIRNAIGANTVATDEAKAAAEAAAAKAAAAAARQPVIVAESAPQEIGLDIIPLDEEPAETIPVVRGLMSAPTGGEPLTHPAFNPLLREPAAPGRALRRKP